MARSRLAGKVVVVTGASAGVGRSIARALGQQGTKVGLIARGLDGLEAAAREIRASGGDALVIPLDVADAAAVEAAADRVVSEWGRLDVWVNNAMVSVFSPVSEMTPGEYRRVTEVSYLGYVHGTLAALKHMRPRDAGVIVQIGSALAYRSIPLQSAYCAAKAALRGFTDALRCELAHDRSNIQVTVVHLPAVNTPQFQVVRNRLPGHPHPVPPIYQPELMAKAVLHAIEHPARELWVGWPTVKAILGQKLIPGLLDRYLGRMAYDAQQTDRFQHRHPDNLDAVLAGDRGAHGEFDDEARANSFEFWMRRHRALLGGLAASALIAVLGARAAWRT
jgi:NAD(P)-dependent dehydrogenase (short-subunit alcohol dehydrogenase family)